MTLPPNAPFLPSAAKVGAPAQAAGDDLPASTATTGVVVPNGGAIHGLLEDFFDVDWFRIELQPGMSYHFDLRGGGSDGSKNGGPDVTDTVLRLRNAAGVEILSNDDIPGSKNTRSVIDYTASVGGTYYLEARVDSGPHGHYLLSATATSPVDDYPDNNNLALMVNGPSILGAIETVADTDRFRVVLTGGTAYDFYLEPRSPNGLGEPRLTLRAADGTPVGTPYSSGRLGFTPPADGVYYLTAAGSGSTTGSYSLRSITAQDDFPAAISTSGNVTVGWEVTGGQLERAGDADYFRVQLEAGKSYAFDLRGNGTKNGPTDTFLRLRAADGSLLASDDDGGNRGSPNGAARILYTASSSGAYYLEASSDAGQTGRYELRAYADDRSDTNATSGTLATSGTAVSGRIDYADDADRFAVALDAGVLYDFSLGGPAWATLGLLSGDGRSVGMWSAQPRHLIAQPDQSGIYYLRVVGEGTPGQSYEVSARPVAGDILASVATTASLNAPGAPVSGVFELPGDRDYYRTELQADKTYFFDLRSHTGSDTHLTLRDTSGRLLREDDDSGGSKQARIAFTPTQSGTYYLDARNDSGVSDSGYTLSTVVDDYPADTGTPGAVTVDGSASAGNLELAGDADYFRVQLAARTSYAFDLRGDGSKSGLGDAHLRLLGSDGSTLASNDDMSYPGGPSRIVFTTTAGGTYYLEASSDSGAIGRYVLSADALPSLSTLAPADNATNVPRSANLVLGYSEAVQAGSGLLTLHGSDGRVLRTVDIQDPSQVRIDGRQLTVNLQDDLAAGTSYYVNSPRARCSTPPANRCPRSPV
jgi:methionine-rich copper-binding protein CopC